MLFPARFMRHKKVRDAYDSTVITNKPTTVIPPPTGKGKSDSVKINAPNIVNLALEVWKPKAN
ncbi:MAG: hypothetical protein H6Q26_145 [Bacteroidetes bacterium]|nr:hypothetical protein [Bacteroidota bacterium]